ncbi:MAG: hypothetical protein K8T91_09330 [Planctomycetes bacterium]|nr:hypothetical protein [Planctomycetota bacterium]
MPENPTNPRANAAKGVVADSPRPLRVAKALPDPPSPTKTGRHALPEDEEGLARPVVLSGPMPVVVPDDPVFDTDGVEASLEPSPVARRSKSISKKKSAFPGWQIGVLAIVALLAIAGAVAALLSHETQVATSIPPAATTQPAAQVLRTSPKVIAPPPIVRTEVARREESLPALPTQKFIDPESAKSAEKTETEAKSDLPGSTTDSKPESSPPSAPQTPASGESSPPPSVTDSHLSGRSYRREESFRQYPQHKPIVDAGLNWLARHQLADGGWAFEHRVGECQARCPNPGDLKNARIAATGLALLPFLGAGHSHLEGPYRRTVAGGLKYIMANQGPRGGMVEAGGQMYGHGIATIALCEALGVVKEQAPVPGGLGKADYVSPGADGVPLAPQEKKAIEREKKLDKALRIDPKALKDAARRAVGVIVAGQHPQGGWRYHPGEAGDMSVVGWQIMALASAQQAGFGFDKDIRNRAFNFLRICGGDMQGDQHYGGIPTRFAYMPPEQKGPTITSATTAIGLLSMIYMGVHPQHPGMEVAVQRLQVQGPNISDMYYTYYANQVMYQHGGPPWEDWKQRTEQVLHGAQFKNDHLDGSWFLPGDHGSQKGGRVYCTVMALLCLEENYRHMRLFNNAIANQNGIPAPPPNNAGGQPNNGALPPAVPPGGAAAAPAAPAVPGQALPPAVPQQGGFGGENLPAGGPNEAIDPGGADRR